MGCSTDYPLCTALTRLCIGGYTAYNIAYKLYALPTTERRLGALPFINLHRVRNRGAEACNRTYRNVNVTRSTNRSLDATLRDGGRSECWGKSMARDQNYG